MGTTDAGAGWTFLTNHARVLALIAQEPEARLRDLATACRVTERTVQGIVADLEAEGYLVRTREGRRNRYRVVYGRPFRHPADAGHDVDGLLAVFLSRAEPGKPGRPDGARAEEAAPDEAGLPEPAQH